ncbi:hypothetical protein ACA910_012591 [Epithemia clementina (nom. ined.)]
MAAVTESTPTHHHRRRVDGSTTLPPTTIAATAGAASLNFDYRNMSTVDDGSGKEGLMMTGDGGSGMGSDSHTRSLVKGITWRVLATSTTTIIALMITGQVEAALQIGMVEFFAKLMIYYIHERVWRRIHCV